MWIAAESICYFSIKDPAFKNTVRFAVKAVGTIIMEILYLVVGLIGLLFAPWWVILLFLLIFPWMYNFFYDYLNLVR